MGERGDNALGHDPSHGETQRTKLDSNEESRVSHCLKGEGGAEWLTVTLPAFHSRHFDIKHQQQTAGLSLSSVFLFSLSLSLSYLVLLTAFFFNPSIPSFTFSINLETAVCVVGCCEN